MTERSQHSLAASDVSPVTIIEVGGPSAPLGQLDDANTIVGGNNGTAGLARASSKRRGLAHARWRLGEHERDRVLHRDKAIEFCTD